MAIDSIGKVIHYIEQQPRWRQHYHFRLISSRWTELVGAVVACQARPIRLDRQTLHVAVANPMWAQTLMLQRLMIVEKINHQLPIDLKDIRFSNGDWFRRSVNASPPAATDRNNLATPEWLRHHPSFVAEAVPDPPPPPAQPATPRSALDSFHQWSTLTQQLNHQQPLCPVCRCHCPEGELRRWSCCSICAAQTFASRQSRPTRVKPYPAASRSRYKAAPQKPGRN